MAVTAAEDRQRTMQLRALRRLSTCEVRGLGVALEQLDTLEAVLIEVLPALRREAEREGRVAVARGIDPARGGARRAWSGARLLLHTVTEAREQTTAATDEGRVPRRAR